MSALFQDPEWPRASAWLAGDALPDAAGPLTIVGAGAARGSITPGRCDLAPQAIRAALERFSTGDLARGADLRALRVRDLGDLAVAELSPEQAFDVIRDAVAACEGAVVVLGGDNSVTRPGCHGLGVPLDRCGLLTFDAHFDLRGIEDGLTNGNPVRALLADGLPGSQIVQIGLQSFANSWQYARVARDAGITVVAVEHVREHGIGRVVRDALVALNARVERIYVDCDIDVLDRVYAPACPGSRPGGLTPFELRQAVRLCGAHSAVKAMDIVEVDPARDVADATVLAAAACVLEFAAGVLERP
jgi:arginase family enzyme